MDTNGAVSVSGAIETTDHSLSLQSRYMLAQVGQQQLVFPSQWISEIVLIDRSQILNLPFYDPAILGLIHHNGAIVPLLSADGLLLGTTDQAMRSRTLKETLTVVQLSPSVEGLAGVGIVVDYVVGSLTPAQIVGQRLFQLSDIPSELWQPRW